MKEITIERITSIASGSKVELHKDGAQHLITKLTLEAEIPAGDLARIHELALKGVTLFAIVGTRQMSFGDTGGRVVNTETGEIS